MIRTYSKKLVEFCGKKGYKASLEYTLDGIQTFTIDIEGTDPLMKDPDFMSLRLGEVRFILPQVLKRRFRLPLYTIKRNGYAIDVEDRKGKSGFPLARNPLILSALLETSSDPMSDTVRIQDMMELSALLVGAKKSGTESVLFFPKLDNCETIPVDLAILLSTGGPAKKEQGN